MIESLSQCNKLSHSQQTDNYLIVTMAHYVFVRYTSIQFDNGNVLCRITSSDFIEDIEICDPVYTRVKTAWPGRALEINCSLSHE